MQWYESFGECLKRCLKEADLSASEAARLVGFRSRNSIFRILSGDASGEIKLRFLHALHDALGKQWPDERWLELQEALSRERLGLDRYRANRAFKRVLHDGDGEIPSYIVQEMGWDGEMREIALAELLDGIAASARAEIVITGCCDSGLARLLADRCGAAGDRGTLAIRQYIDTTDSLVTRNILGILPLISKTWYNARLLDSSSCPEEMMAIYRLHAIHVHQWDAEGQQYGKMLIRIDETHFAYYVRMKGQCPPITILDRLRYDLELLKPLPSPTAGGEAFVEYTRHYAELEDNCTILSVKPDVHFNCIPTALLEQAVVEGFEQSGMAAGTELISLIDALKQVHDQRFRNMMAKHKPTHLVYSLASMERFMRTGVLSDQFFIQRAYTVEERRQIIRTMLDAMRQQPWFNVHFMREEAPALRYEISCYEGKGVLLMDAYTGYELSGDHSEALITLPAFMESFQRYFKEELLAHYVMSQGETIRALEGLLVMNVEE